MGQNNKTLRQYRRSGIGRVLKLDVRCHSYKEKMGWLDYIKIRVYVHQKMSLINAEESHIMRENIYNMSMAKGSHSEYVKITDKSIRKRANSIQNKQTSSFAKLNVFILFLYNVLLYEFSIIYPF